MGFFRRWRHCGQPVALTVLYPCPTRNPTRRAGAATLSRWSSPCRLLALSHRRQCGIGTSTPPVGRSGPRRFAGWTVQMRLSAQGSRGRVHGPPGCAVDFIVEVLDPVEQRWSWRARVLLVGVRLHREHGVHDDRIGAHMVTHPRPGVGGPGVRTRGPVVVDSAGRPVRVMEVIADLVSVFGDHVSRCLIATRRRPGRQRAHSATTRPNAAVTGQSCGPASARRGRRARGR